jgi:hypothetical protein
MPLDMIRRRGHLAFRRHLDYAANPAGIASALLAEIAAQRGLGKQLGKATLIRKPTAALPPLVTGGASPGRPHARGANERKPHRRSPA